MRRIREMFSRAARQFLAGPVGMATGAWEQLGAEGREKVKEDLVRALQGKKPKPWDRKPGSSGEDDGTSYDDETEEMIDDLAEKLREGGHDLSDTLDAFREARERGRPTR